MPTPKLTDEQLREAWALYVAHGSSCKDAAEAAGIPYNTMNGPHADSYVDGAGYIAIAAELSE